MRNASRNRKQSRQKNKVRGLLGTVRDRSFDSLSRDRGKLYRAGIRKTLLDARVGLLPSEFDEFLAWSDNLFRLIIPKSVAKEPIDQTYLNESLTSAPLPLQSELLWVSSRLRIFADQINKFRAHAERIEERFHKNDTKASFKGVLQLEKDLGPSLWSVSLNIAIRQKYQGLEKQKRYASRIKGRGRKGLLGYYAHYISVRNENNASYSGFFVEIGKRIANTKITEDFRTYLIFKFTGFLPENSGHLAAILRFEQSNSEIDIYETFLHIVQKIISNNDDPRLLNTVKQCVEKVSGIADWRLDKAALCLGVAISGRTLPSETNPSLDLLFLGSPAKAYHSALKGIEHSKQDISSTIAAAYAASVRQHHRPDSKALVSKLALLVAKAPGFDRALDEIEKLANNFSTFPFFSALAAFARSEGEPFRYSAQKMGILRALNSPALDVLDAVFVSLDQFPFPARDADQSGLASRTITAVRHNQILPTEVHPLVSSYLLGISHMAQRNYDQALSALEVARKADKSPLTIPAQLISLKALIRSGDHLGAVRLTALLATDYPQTRDILPISAALGSSAWPDLEPLASDISLAITLDLMWRAEPTSEAATNRRFAFEEFLIGNDIEKPSGLAERLDEFKPEQLVYFLRHVCVQSVMDMSEAFRSSRELDEERINICRILRELDFTNRQEYQDEIFLLTQQLEVQDGLRLYDRSRLHVDVEAVSQWARSELMEQFLRYRDLIRAGIGQSGDFTELLRALFKSGADVKDYFSVPDNQADNILLTMTITLRDNFLYDSAHGLDSYLSKRVRHGSIVNYLRSPVERANLITQRESGRNEYKDNEFWLSQLEGLTDQEKSEVSHHFKVFASSFDEIVLRLKEKVLHIRGTEHPEGVLEIPINGPAFHVVRVGMQTDMTFDSFLKSSFVAFWSILELSLKRLRDELLVNTKTEIAEAFQRLRAGVGPFASSSPSFPKLSMEIGNVSAEVQAQADAMSGWFKRSGALEGGHLYSLEQAFRIAVASALNTLRSFHPIIETAIRESTVLNAQSMIIISECIWAIIENIKLHSGLQNPRIWISAFVDLELETITFTVKNSVSPRLDQQHAWEKLNNIRQGIVDGSYKDFVRSDTNSGLRKIASVVAQSERGNIDFGFVETNTFFVTVTMSLVLQTGAPDAVKSA